MRILQNTRHVQERKKKREYFFQGTKKARTVVHVYDGTRLPRGHIAIECCGAAKHCCKREEKSKCTTWFGGLQKGNDGDESCKVRNV